MLLSLVHFSFYCYPTVWINPLITAIFFPFSAGCFYRWREEGSQGRGRKWGGVCDWVSPPLCCLAHDKPLLFYQDLPSLACLLQIAALFRSVLHVVVARLCLTLWPTSDPPPLQSQATSCYLAGLGAASPLPDRTGRAR